ncbi:hypothetical protein OG568_47335 [Streptomyces sp. NBC_01450]|uniref:hypothetical protein n=1 Tax=Streptomyces sp. NBC_01450 TaxID=2903871 RepID=UPI002E353F7D|nr:hypothetical protein [Streptomyces sp. NBC_01450]
MTTPTATRPETARTHRASPSRRATVVRMAVHLIGPVLVCLGLGVTYLSAFHHPQPNELKVAIVGTTPKTKVLAQTIKDKAGDSLNVITVPTRQQARAHLMDHDLVGAFVPAPSHPELMIARAGSNAAANATETIFRMVTDQQGVSLKVTDVAPLAKGDPGGGGLFFILIALSIASYIGALTLAPAAGMLSMRVRAALGLGVSLAISAIAIFLAGPVFDVVDHSYGTIWAMFLLYSAGVVAIGLGLQTFLKQLTPLALMGLFVMLNLTSAGGLTGPELQNTFYGTLHSFWNGAAFVEGTRSALYFDHAGLGSHLLALWLWLAAGVVLTLLAARAERKRKPRPHPGPEALQASAAEELAAGGWAD